MSISCDNCPVRDRAACAALDEDEREALAATGRTRELSRGEMLFAAGDEEAACATLLSGVLKVSATDRDGNEQILALIHPAGFVGELFQPFAHHDVIALTDCRLCTFARADMENAIERFPALALALLRRSHEDLHATRELLELTARASANTRIASLILAMARSASDSPCHPAAQFDLPLSRGEIGNMLGLTIETVSRKMGEFERAGAIRRNGKRGVELLDHEQLMVMAGADQV